MHTRTHILFYSQPFVHAVSKFSTQSVEQQTGYREEDVLPKGLDDKQLRDNRETDAGSCDKVLTRVTIFLFLCCFILLLA